MEYHGGSPGSAFLSSHAAAAHAGNSQFQRCLNRCHDRFVPSIVANIPFQASRIGRFNESGLTSP
jgi:hypothetical protein